MLKKVDESQTALDETITQLMHDMKMMDGDSEEYATCLNRLERLMKQKEKFAPKRISPDTLVLVGANLLGIVIIVAWEHGHVISSKALSHIVKPR